MADSVEAPAAFRLVARSDQGALFALPWTLPLEDWPAETFAEAAVGIHRHVVKFVAIDGRLFALKELPQPLAWREYRLLTALEDDEVPSVEIVGVVERGSLPAVLITRYLEFSLPYRLILKHGSLPCPEQSIGAGLAELLVRLHLAGVFWGDCSLSNALFRRDAGTLLAHLVDIETGEMHDRLSDGQRRYDVAIAEENIMGELLDLEAELGRTVVDDPVAFADGVGTSYTELWDELTREEVFATHDGHRLEERLRRLNELGFDVDEVEVVASGDEARLILHPKVVEPGHHRRRLLRLTGLDTQENQARRLLNDIAAFRAYLEQTTGGPVPDPVVANRWLAEVYDPVVHAIPDALRGKLDEPEVFHEVLEHRWFLSEKAGRDVGTTAAARDYFTRVLPSVPDSLTQTIDPTGADAGFA